ncbi:MAG TPA: GTP 3',8-cyclase MoaA [Desulfobacteraceae bacterium]|nr:GTP 3',8-cyclase MoaA [Desulfobacteraceae bacterium]
MFDCHARKIDYLRISITDRCNLNCQYCAPHPFLSQGFYKEILSYEEILRLVKIGVGLGISKVRITGGEPLVRRGVYDFLEKIVQIKGLNDVSLTTNGVLLKPNIHKIKSAGIKRINISLDTLNRKKYKKITGSDCFDRVREGIESARQYGFDPIRINAVILKGINDNELIDFAKISFFHPFQIRFIEYMPMGATTSKKDWHIPMGEMKKKIKGAGKLTRLAGDLNDGPVKRYKFENAKGEIGFISPVSDHFCEKCNRIRLTAKGNLRPCLLSDYEVDIKKALRTKASDRQLSDIFIKAVRSKPAGHDILKDNHCAISTNMAAIGG